MELWDDLISRSISEVAPTIQSDHYSQNYEIALGHSLSPSYAYAYFPVNDGSSIWFNQSYTSGTNDLVTPQIGTHGFTTYLHEIGHALVLNHMGDYNGSDNNGPSSVQDSTVFTIMSYYGPSWGDWAGAGLGVVEWADWVGANGILYSPQTPMLYDVYAIQIAYGIDNSTRKNNTVYGFNSNISGVQSSIFNFQLNTNPIITIYDAGGNDTFDFSGWSSNSYISLESATYSSVNHMTKNIWIAYSVLIENAVTGSGNDTIIGNSSNNILDGGGGDDLFWGNAGNDSLKGGAGIDYACYAYNHNNYTVVFASGIYTVTSAYEGKDTLSGIEYLRFLDGDFLLTSLVKVADTIAPVLQSATTNANGTKIILTYDELLGLTVPTAKAFVVTVAGKAVTVSSVAAVDSTIELTLSSLIKSSQVITVTYTSPKPSALISNAAIQDESGNDAIKFSKFSVENISAVPAPDTTAPILQGAMTSVDGTQIALFFDEVLGIVTAPKKSFSVAIGKTKIGVTNVSIVGSLVILDLASTIAGGQPVVVSYAAPKKSALISNAAIQDESGNDAIKFSNFSVENLVIADASMAFTTKDIELVGIISSKVDPYFIC